MKKNVKLKWEQIKINLKIKKKEKKNLKVFHFYGYWNDFNFSG
jgi:hypothetical protein